MFQIDVRTVSYKHLDVYKRQGVLYTVLKDEESACRYYKKGSTMLEENCKYNLAIINQNNKNEKDAISLYKYLHKIDNDKGCFNIGLIMEKNNNLEEAERYYKKSADQGHTKDVYKRQ